MNKKNSLIYGLFVLCTVVLASCTTNITPPPSSEPVLNCELGDIILNDMTTVPRGVELTTEQKSKAIAVVVDFTKSHRPIGLGLQESSYNCKFANEGSTGYSTKFDKIVCINSKNTSQAETAEFSGDAFGGDNWDEVCKADPNARNSTGNYPAFQYALYYGSGMPGNLKNGWYLPTIIELTNLYKNKNEINKIIQAAGGTELKYWYKTSSQGIYANESWDINFDNGSINDEDKSIFFKVRCLRVF